MSYFCSQSSYTSLMRNFSHRLHKLGNKMINALQWRRNYMNYKVLKAVKLSMLFSVVAPWGLVGIYQRLGGTNSFHHEWCLYLPTSPHGASTKNTNFCMLEIVCVCKMFSRLGDVWKAVTCGFRLNVKKGRKIYSNEVHKFYQCISLYSYFISLEVFVSYMENEDLLLCL